MKYLLMLLIAICCISSSIAQQSTNKAYTTVGDTIVIVLPSTAKYQVFYTNSSRVNIETFVGVEGTPSYLNALVQSKRYDMIIKRASGVTTIAHQINTYLMSKGGIKEELLTYKLYLPKGKAVVISQ